jgi:hypothetical protein
MIVCRVGTSALPDLSPASEPAVVAGPLVGVEATLPLLSICLTPLRQRQAAQNRARTAASAAWNRSDLMFTTRYGDPMEPCHFIAARCAAAELRQITVHDAAAPAPHCSSTSTPTLGRDADLAPCPVRRDHGNLCISILNGHPGSTQTTGNLG